MTADDPLDAPHGTYRILAALLALAFIAGLLLGTVL